MGLLDSVLGQVLGGGANAGAGGSMGAGLGAGGGDAAALLRVVVQMLGNNAAGGGGIADLVARFQRGGLGDVIGSWISSGQNLPVSADQLRDVLGPEVVGALTGGGAAQNDVWGQLAKVLPQVVDHLTPNGNVPQGGFGSAGDVIGALESAFGGAAGASGAAAAGSGAGGGALGDLIGGLLGGARR